MIIVGTAGHIDHGKTTLVRSLTGVDTDRLKEEKQRGISIELGFAYLDLPGDQRVGLIDVPGHEKFVHHMIAGATGVDLVLLVVAADEGVMPQTKEHLAICELLGMNRGGVIVTKTDLVDEEWLELVVDDLQDYLKSTFLSGAPVLRFSSTWTGDRLETFRAELYSELHELASQVEKGSLDRPFMMPVDRVFTIKGFGTVVTGTIQSGKLQAGDQVAVLPSHQKAKVRRLEIHGKPAEQSRAGLRTAVNIPDVATGGVQRGNVLTVPGALDPLRSLSAVLKTVPNLQVELKGQFKALFHTGSALAEAAVRLLDVRQLGPGCRGLVAMRLETPVALLPGDRYILRGFSHMAEYGKTIGGGVVLWPAGVKARDKELEMLSALDGGAEPEMLEAVTYLAGLNGLSEDKLPFLLPFSAERLQARVSGAERLTNLHRLTVGNETRLVHRDHVGLLKQRLEGTVDEFHGANPRRKGISREELKSKVPEFFDRLVVQGVLDLLVAEGVFTADELHVWRPGFAPCLDSHFLEIMETIEAALSGAGLEPPTRDALAETYGIAQKDLSDALGHLVQAGRIEKISSELYFHQPAFAKACGRLTEFLKSNGTVTTQQLKEMFGISRKFLIPLAEHFDATKLTVRIGPAERKLRGA